MFIGGMTNEHIRTGLPNAFLCSVASLRATMETVPVQHQTLICYLMPVSLKNKNSVHY